MLYTVSIEKSALKALKKIPKESLIPIMEEIGSLQKNPRPIGHIKLKGNENLYRIRSGNYRIIYEIHDKSLIVLVVRIGDRKDVYRDY